MNKIMMTGILTGMVVAFAVGSTGFQQAGKGSGFAEVVAVEEIKLVERVSHEVCKDVAATQGSATQHKAPEHVPGGKQRCYNTGSSHDNTVTGYEVLYRLGNELGRVRVGRHPGDRIALEKGRLVLDAAGITGRSRASLFGDDRAQWDRYIAQAKTARLILE